MATHSSILTGRIPWTAEPVGLQSMGSQRAGHCLATKPSPLCVCSVASVVSDSVIPRTMVRQTPLSMEFSKQVYWSGLPCPSPEDLPDPGIESESLPSPALADEFFSTGATQEAQLTHSLQFSHSVMSDSLRPHESQHARPPCPSPTHGVHSDSYPSSR